MAVELTVDALPLYLPEARGEGVEGLVVGLLLSKLVRCYISWEYFISWAVYLASITSKWAMVVNNNESIGVGRTAGSGIRIIVGLGGEELEEETIEDPSDVVAVSSGLDGIPVDNGALLWLIWYVITQ